MKKTAVLVILSSLSACMTTQQPIQPARQQPIDEATLALSCQDLSTRNNKIKTRMMELEAENRRQQRQSAVTGAVLDVGLGALVGAGARSGLSGLRNASTAASAINGVRNAETASNDLGKVQDALVLGRRSAELQRAMIEKGC